jgi:hypothetical protein
VPRKRAGFKCGPFRSVWRGGLSDEHESPREVVAEVPEAERVDIAEWGDLPSFRVRGKNFVFFDAKPNTIRSSTHGKRRQLPSLPTLRPRLQATVSLDTAGSSTSWNRSSWSKLMVCPLSSMITARPSGLVAIAAWAYSQGQSWPSRRRSSAPVRRGAGPRPASPGARGVEQLDRLRGCRIAEGRRTAEPLRQASEPGPGLIRSRRRPVVGGPLSKNVPALLGWYPLSCAFGPARTLLPAATGTAVSLGSLTFAVWSPLGEVARPDGGLGPACGREPRLIGETSRHG